MAAPTYYSTQLTAIDAGTYQGAGTYIAGTEERPLFLGTLAFGSGIMAKSEDVAMVRLPKGIITLQVGILVSESLGSAAFSIGILGTTAKYKALGTQTGATGWIWYMLESAWDDGPLTAAEEIRITNDATAAFPTTSGGSINMAFECLVP
jgi:hypothetical protein